MLNESANKIYTIPAFTKREREIIEQLMKGKLNKEIAHQLQISLSSVKKHTKNIYRKTGVHRRVEVVVYLSNAISA